MMEDWKQRLLDEYLETKSRYEKLKAYNTKFEINERLEYCARKYPSSCKENEDRARSMVRNDLLTSQQHAMEDYLRLLELRMALEGIEISF